jgi:hypothetical protein
MAQLRELTDAPDEAHAPDLAEPLYGWRLWRVLEQADGSAVLTSIVRNVEWPKRRELTAECFALNWSWWPIRRTQRQQHRAPDSNCPCGIYAAADVEHALRYLEVCNGLTLTRPVVALGVVGLWGRVLECERGLRAPSAYPRRLYLLGPQTPDAGRLAEALGGYGVPVHVLDASAGSVAECLAARREQVSFQAPSLPHGR